MVGATPEVKKVRSRWDETPQVGGVGGATPLVGVTPVGGADLATPMTGQIGIGVTPEQMNELRFQKEVDERNRPWADEELDALFPPDGYEILEPPASYKPLVTRRLPVARLNIRSRLKSPRRRTTSRRLRRRAGCLL